MILPPRCNSFVRGDNYNKKVNVMSFDNREKILLIVNPKAGKMAIKNELLKIVCHFSDSGFEPVIYTTQKQGDATKIAKDISPRFDRIVCCGGDGTLNEVVTGLMDLPPDKRCPLGFIPMGTTNDLAETFSLPKTAIGAAKVITDNNIEYNDVGSFNRTKYFNYIASCGMFTSTSYSTPQAMKNSLGHMAYIFEGIKSLNDIKPTYMKISSDAGNYDGEFIFTSITNALSVGGIYKFGAEFVKLNDGAFEVILVRKPKNASDLIDIFYRLSNLDYDENQVVFFHTSKLNIECEEPIKWTVDGEYAGKCENVFIQNIPQAIRVFKNKE